MTRSSLVACLIVAACGKSAKPSADGGAARDAQIADASAAADSVATRAAEPGDAGTASASAAAKVLEIVLVDRVACARRADGRVRCWGSPWDGRGLPVVASASELPEMTTAVAIDLGIDQALYVVTDDGRVRRGILDLRGTTQLAELEGIDDVIDVSAHRSGPLVLTRTGGVITPASSTPILTNAVALRRAANGSIQVLHRDGRVSWFDGKTHEVPGLTDATALFGDQCAETRAGKRVCWETRRVKAWGGATNIIDRVNGLRFRCDLTSSGVACAGGNEAGQLGAGPGPSRGEAKSVDLPAKAIAIAAGARSVCAVLETGEVACWGANDGGQLGDGTLLDRPTPSIVPGLTTPAAPRPSDGRAKVQESATAMDWTGLPASCTRPSTIAQLASVASAYAYPSKAGTIMWLADFALEPTGHTAPLVPVRGTQRAIQIALANGRRAVDRGRYASRGPKTARFTVHAAEHAPAVAGKVDLVVELVDKAWICGQLLAVDGSSQRQPFAARILKRAP